MAAVTLLGMLAGCRGPSGRVVAVIPKGQPTGHTDVFWQQVHAGALKAGQEFHINIEWNAPAHDGDYRQQIEIVENFIHRRVNGILLAPSDRKLLASVINKAVQDSIPVVIFESGADTENYVSFVATDNYAGGVLAARRMGELLKGQGQVAVIAGHFGGVSTLARQAGFEETLAKEFPDIEVVTQPLDPADSASPPVAADILTEYPDLAGIFACNESSSVDLAQALKARGLAGQFPVVASDASAALQDDLKAGVFDSLVVQNPYKMGYQGVKALADYWAGRKPARRIDSGVALVKREDLAKPEVQKLLNPPPIS